MKTSKNNQKKLTTNVSQKKINKNNNNKKLKNNVEKEIKKSTHKPGNPKQSVEPSKKINVTKESNDDKIIKYYEKKLKLKPAKSKIKDIFSALAFGESDEDMASDLDDESELENSYEEMELAYDNDDESDEEVESIGEDDDTCPKEVNRLTTKSKKNNKLAPVKKVSQNYHAISSKLKLNLCLFKRNSALVSLKNMDAVFDEFPFGEVSEIMCEICTNTLQSFDNASLIDLALLVSGIHIRKRSRMNFLVLFIEKLMNQLYTKFPIKDWHSNNVEEILKFYCVMLCVTRLGMIDSAFIFDMLFEITEIFGEVHVDILYRFFNYAGANFLQKSNPDRMKELIDLIQKKYNDSHDKICTNTNMKFNCEGIIIKCTKSKIKNDELTKLVKECEKILKSLYPSNSSRQNSILLRLTELSSDNPNKWWLVGAGVNPDVTTVTNINVSTQHKQQITNMKSEYSQEKLNLANKLGFRTFEKQELFCLLDEYKESSNRKALIAKLARKIVSKQDKAKHPPTMKLLTEDDVVDVVLRCLVLDSEWIPDFYPLLMIELSNLNRKYRHSFKCGFWDFYKKDSLKVHPMMNLGRCMAHVVLINYHHFPFHLIKVYNFNRENEPNTAFLRCFLGEIFRLAKKNEISYLFDELFNFIALPFVIPFRKFVQDTFVSDTAIESSIAENAKKAVVILDDFISVAM